MQRYSQGQDGDHRRGDGKGSSTPPKKGGEGRLHVASFLGSSLWDKTIPYDPDLKVTLEHMELEDFLTENDVMPLDDHSVHKSLDFLSRCGTDSVCTTQQDKSTTGHPIPSTSYTSNRHHSASSSTFSSPLHTPPSSSPAYNVPSPSTLNNANDSSDFNFPPSSNNHNNSPPVNNFLTALGNSSSPYHHSSPGSSAGHLVDLSNSAPNQGTSLSDGLKEPNLFFGHPTDSPRLSESSNSNGKPGSNGRNSPVLNIDACSQLLFADTDLLSTKSTAGGTLPPKKKSLPVASTNINNDYKYDSSIKNNGGTTVSANPVEPASSCGKRWQSFSTGARPDQKGRANSTYDSNHSAIYASQASSIFEIPPTPNQTLKTPVKKRAYNKKINNTSTQPSGDRKPKVECVYDPPSTDTPCSSSMQRTGKIQQQFYHEPSDDSSSGSVGSKGSNCNNIPPRRRGPYGLGKRQAAAVAAIALAPETPSPPNSPTCSSPTSSRSSCYSPQPPHSPDYPHDEKTMTAVASTPGRDSFNPRTRSFTGEELKPQPMIKKSRKQYVPSDLKDDKYWARRRKNNVAAKRSRDARRVKENQIALRATFLEETHQKLARDLQAANRTVEMLKKRLAKYEPV